MSALTPLDRRIPLAHLPTPLEPLDRLGAHLGMAPGRLWVKRDDLTGLGGGGNKARKLEYLCADALAQGCDTLVTGGGRQSNHVRMTAAAANRLGLHCTIVVNSVRPDVPTGNVLLDELLGPEIVWIGRTPAAELDYYGIEAVIADTCSRLEAGGRRPYAMPIGGASPVGALGYVRAGIELRSQDPSVDVVVVADGSGGTHAGLVAGLGDHRMVYGVDVGARPDVGSQVPPKAAEVARLAGLDEPTGDPGPGGLPAAVVDHDHFGPDYGAATDDCLDALRLAARLEGLLLDPVYTGKAMVGLVEGVRSGRIPADAKVVFLHTGGLPALFAEGYGAWIRS